jgi:WG containing repeat
MKQVTAQNGFISTFFFVFLLCFTPLFAQREQIKLVQAAYTKAQEMPISKNLIKNRPFHFFGSPSEGLHVAQKDGRFGYMNNQYGWQVSPQYDFAFSFNEGLGIVFLDGKPSYIDKKGQLVIYMKRKNDTAKIIGRFEIFR